MPQENGPDFNLPHRGLDYLNTFHEPLDEDAVLAAKQPTNRLEMLTGYLNDILSDEVIDRTIAMMEEGLAHHAAQTEITWRQKDGASEEVITLRALEEATRTTAQEAFAHRKLIKRSASVPAIKHTSPRASLAEETKRGTIDPLRAQQLLRSGLFVKDEATPTKSTSSDFTAVPPPELSLPSEPEQDDATPAVDQQLDELSLTNLWDTDTSVIPQTIKQRPAIDESKRPNKLAQALLKHRYIFEIGYSIQESGASIPRWRILGGYTLFLGDNRTYAKHRDSRQERWQNNITETLRPTRRKMGAAMGALALTATLGVAAFGLSHNTSAEVASNPKPIAAATHEIATPPSTIKAIEALPQLEKREATTIVHSFNAEQKTAFINMLEWVDAHPGQDFSANFQAAFVS